MAYRKMKLLWFVIATCLCLASSYDVTTRILGRDGYCVTVRDPDYHNGVPTVAVPCSSSPSEVTQLWTFGSDGTIKSNGKCLMAYDDSPSSYIMMYTCPNPIKDSTRWKLGDSGKLSSKSGLVLTTDGSDLILDIDVSSSYQTWWLQSNSTKPRAMLLLVGQAQAQAECMTLSGSSEVLIKTCDLSNSAQRWLDYPDGTIRPVTNVRRCVSYEDPYNARVIVTACGLSASNQRWYFPEKDSNIVVFNERARLALERTQDNKIYAYPPSGKENQEWFRRPI